MTQWQLAQLNIGRAKAAMDDPIMAGFTNELDAINLLAEQSPGFVWRLQSDSGNATDIAFSSDPLLIANLSVWESVEALQNYVYSGAHLASLKQRRSWFEKIEGPSLVLWWIVAGHTPTLAEAKVALDLLKLNGPNHCAFTFAKPFPAPKTQTISATLEAIHSGK